jgi:DNA primase
MPNEKTISEIKARVPVYEVAARYLEIKRQGNTYFALCPYHAEKTPSFKVPAPTVERQQFYCFGCQKTGDVIELHMHLSGANFNDAVAQLAGGAGVTVNARQTYKKPTTPFKGVAKAKDGFERFDAAAMERLARWQELLKGSPAQAYLEKRKIPLEVAQKVGAGFLPANERMSGLPVLRRFPDQGERVVFPHTLPDETVVSLYGRALTDDQGKHCHMRGAKALLNAKALKLDGDLWIVEGAFDALALMAYGVEKVVAVFGLDGFDFRWFAKQRKIIVALDHDEAGNRAWGKLALEAAYWGFSPVRLPKDVLGGLKDISDAWTAGLLNLGEFARPAEQSMAQTVVRQLTNAAPTQRFIQRQFVDFKTVALQFALTSLDLALSKGWTLEELFSLPSFENGFDGGFCWSVAFSKVAAFEVEQDELVAITKDKSRLVMRRKQMKKPSCILPWAEN